jgi:hypothetical protein
LFFFVFFVAFFWHYSSLSCYPFAEGKKEEEKTEVQQVQYESATYGEIERAGFLQYEP